MLSKLQAPVSLSSLWEPAGPPGPEGRRKSCEQQEPTWPLDLPPEAALAREGDGGLWSPPGSRVHAAGPAWRGTC